MIHEKIFDKAEDIIKNPDKILLQWIYVEYRLFCAYYLAAIFEGNGLPFSKEEVTEKNKKPYFISPSVYAYHNLNYDSDRLIVYARKIYLRYVGDFFV